MKPYFASPGLSIIPLVVVNIPPGLYLQLIVLGRPATFSRKSICVKSSKLIVASNCRAFTNSSAGVTLEENIISSPLKSIASASISSVSDEQSTPHPSSFNIFSI